MTGAHPSLGPVHYGIAARPMSGYGCSGDEAVALATGDGALLAVIDGLGHGPDAAEAANVAAAALRAHSEKSATALLQRCHQALRRTRGAAISLAKVASAGAIDWVAVGNVQGTLVRAAPAGSTRLIARGGVVGLRLPRMHPTTARLGRGDFLVVFTDGIADAPIGNLPRAASPQRNAQQLLDRRATGTDDALVLVAAYVGAAT